MKAILFGAEADALLPLIEKEPSIQLVDHAPDVILCYGGDGTLLSSELKWPGVPKVPIRNSRRGHRCIPHPPEEVIHRLVTGQLRRTEFIKIGCTLLQCGSDSPPSAPAAMNEFNVHMGHINLAVRFHIWINNEPYENGAEIIGDGFVVSTPFGSTAYFNQITRGIFYAGLGLAFKNIAELTSHVVVPDTAVIRAEITRGPAVMAYDNAPNYIELKQGDQLEFRKHPVPATVLTWSPLAYPSKAF